MAIRRAMDPQLPDVPEKMTVGDTELPASSQARVHATGYRPEIAQPMGSVVTFECDFQEKTGGGGGRRLQNIKYLARQL
jgi:hypothetical protein